MNEIPSDVKKILVESAIAAANHGLRTQALSLMKAFPWLIDNDEDRCVCTCLIFFALGDLTQAIRALNGFQSAKVNGLRMLCMSLPAQTDTQTICNLLSEK